MVIKYPWKFFLKMYSFKKGTSTNSCPILTTSTTTSVFTTTALDASSTGESSKFILIKTPKFKLALFCVTILCSPKQSFFAWVNLHQAYFTCICWFSNIFNSFCSGKWVFEISFIEQSSIHYSQILLKQLEVK